MRTLFLLFACSILWQTIYAQRVNEEELPYYETQLYFKLNDNYRVDYENTPVVNVEAEIPFFLQYQEEYGVRTIIRPFFFSEYEPLRRVYRIVASSPGETEKLLRILNEAERETLDYTEYVPRLRMVGTAQSTDPDWSHQWYLDLLQVQDAWNEGAYGQEITVAVVDNGFQLGHKDIDFDRWATPFDMAHWDSDPTMLSTGGMSYHGTHVAALAGAAMTDNGFGMAAINPESQVMPIKAAYDISPNYIGDGFDDLIMGYESLEAAITLKANIINASWGAYFHSPTGQLVIDHAEKENIIIVAAAGNDNFQENDNFYYEYFYPAAYDYVVSVAATDENDDKWSDSNYGKWIDVAAPGHKIYSAILNSDFSWKSGTSMSAPIVSAVAALAWSVDPSLPATAVIGCVTNHVDPVDPHYMNQLGQGRVNAYLAVQCATEVALNQNDVTQNTTAENGTILYFSAAPNPMNVSTKLTYKLSRADRVQLTLFDQGGNRVRNLINNYRLGAGEHHFLLNRNGLRAGLYFARLQVGSEVRDAKVYIID